MKRILFIIPAFNLGGTNKVLENILSCMDNNKYLMDLFVISHIGRYKDKFSDRIILKRSLLLSAIFDSYDEIKKEPFIEKIKKITIKTLYRILKVFTGNKAIKWIYKNEAKIIENMTYDIIIAMQEGRATHFVSHINKQKVAWIHSDYSEYFKIVKENEEDIYNKYNHIICVSKYTKDVFVNHYPSLQRKCYGIHNMIDDKSIINLANETIEIDKRFNTNQFNIISIGRLSKVKQFDVIPQIAYELRASGCDFMWYIIGSGEEKDAISYMIKRYQVSDYVVLLGEKINPYPYIKQTDLLVSTSLSEACPNVINEAKILHIPVVTTDFGSAQEFIESGKNGIIASKDNIRNAIEVMIKNKEVYGIIKRNISTFEYSNKKIVEQIEKLLYEGV